MVRPSCPRLWNPVVCSRATANDGPKGGTWKRWPSESCMANKTKKATTLRQNTRSKGPIQLVMYFMTIQLKPQTTMAKAINMRATGSVLRAFKGGFQLMGRHRKCVCLWYHRTNDRRRKHADRPVTLATRTCSPPCYQYACDN